MFIVNQDSTLYADGINLYFSRLLAEMTRNASLSLLNTLLMANRLYMSSMNSNWEANALCFPARKSACRDLSLSYHELSRLLETFVFS